MCFPDVRVEPGAHLNCSIFQTANSLLLLCEKTKVSIRSHKKRAGYQGVGRAFLSGKGTSGGKEQGGKGKGISKKRVKCNGNGAVGDGKGRELDGARRRDRKAHTKAKMC